MCIILLIKTILYKTQRLVTSMLKIFGIKSKTRNICNWHDVENVDGCKSFLL